ncbi:MAG: thioredoxin-disulfide reductase [Candidatus Dependentiae bacterium]|nr:thioredoxin-disulfide reductase [Candidatus Dependentiae bacterium]
MENTTPSKTHSLVIIGAGPAGLTAGIYAARANLNPVIIEGPKPGGQLMGTTDIENWPGNGSISGPSLMINMAEHAKKFNVKTISGSVTSVDLSKKPFSMTIDGKNQIQAHSIIIATGATPNKLNCPGEQEFWGKGVSTCAVCDGAFYRNQEVVVVGGGDSSMESASFLHRNGNNVTIVHISDKLTASHAMQARVLSNNSGNASLESIKPGFKIIYNSTVTSVNGSGGKITSLTITNQQTQDTQELQADAMFLAIGLKPNTTMFEDQIDRTHIGHIKVHDLVKTSVPGVFAAGDVQDPKYRQAIVSAGFGCIASLEAERYLADQNLE